MIEGFLEFAISFEISSNELKHTINYEDIDTYSASNNVNMVIEIPAGTNKKIEYDKNLNDFFIDKMDGVDRVINFLPYPGNYGFIPSTKMDKKRGGDGDALDILLISESMDTGTIVDVIPNSYTPWFEEDVVSGTTLSAVNVPSGAVVALAVSVTKDLAQAALLKSSE